MYTFVVAYYTDHAGYSRASVFGVGEDGLRAKSLCAAVRLSIASWFVPVPRPRHFQCIVRTKPKSVA